MNCRKVAINILERIINEGAYSNIILSNELNNSDLSDKDKALVTEIVYGTLRRLKTIDTIIASFVKDISIMDKKILNILRVAVYQMNYLDKVPSYAACNEAVEEAKEISDKDSKLVNGILRNFVKKEGKFDIVFRNKIDEIAFDLSFEPWMVRMFIKQYGEHEALEILEGLNNTPKMTVRVNSIKGDYEIKNFNLDEAKEIIKTRPQNLSLNEMFMVANSYPKGSQEFIDVFETAVRMYPKDEIASINAAAAALSRNDLVSAERYLNMVNVNKQLPEYSNAMGVLMLLKGEYEHAEEYLKAAAKSGLQAAGQNLEELAKKKTNAAEIEKKKRK